MSEGQIIDLYILYLQGKLTAEEEKVFNHYKLTPEHMKRLNEAKILQSSIRYFHLNTIKEQFEELEFETYNNEKSDEFIKEGIIYNQRKELLSKLTRIEQQIYSEQNNQTLKNTIGNSQIKFTTNRKIRTISLFQRIALAASLLIGIFGVIWIFSKNDYIKIYNESFSIPGQNIIVRSDLDTINKLQIQAYAYYDLKRYSEAIPLFDSLSVNALDRNALFYKAICQMALLDNISASYSLEKFISVNPQNIRAKYYQAINFIKLNKLKEARMILKEISSTNNDYSILASQLLNKLN